jgi:hypothetical protein
MLPRCLQRAALVAVTALALPSVAHAQQPGGGVDAGPLTISPSLTLEGGYNSNINAESIDEGRDGGTSVSVNPAVAVRTEDPTMVDFGANLGLTWDKYIFSEDVPNADQTGISAVAGASLRFNPNGIVSLRPFENFRRQSTPSANPEAEPYRITANEAGVEFGFHPGGALESSRLGPTARLTGRYQTFRIEDQPGLGTNNPAADLDIRWYFLPKTAVFATAQYGSTNHVEPTIGTRNSGTVDESAVEIPNSDARNMRFAGGFTGLLTRHLSLLVRAGYGRADYATGSDSAGVIAQGELNVALPGQTSFGVGYLTDFADATVGTSFVFHRAYAGVQLHPWISTIEVDAYFQRNVYETLGDIPTITVNGRLFDLFNTADRRDNVINSSARLGFDVTRWMNVGLRYVFEFKDSNLLTTSPTAPSNPAASNSSDYTRHVGLLSLRFAL